MNIPRELLEPWAITPEAYRGLFDERLRAVMARPAVEMDGSSHVAIRPEYPNVAIIHVKGALVRYTSWWGGTSYGEIAKDLQRCLDDASVRAIAWSFDSPGGEVNGMDECAAMIYAARGKKPMAAYVSGTCASAALGLASAVGKLKCSASAIVGSVGVITMMYDDSKMLQDIGIKEFEMVASQSPKKSQQPGDATYRARVQQRLDDLCEVFIASLARNYAITPALVQKNFGQGDVFVGQKAVDAGLCVDLSSFESVLAELAGRNTSTLYSGVQMAQMESTRVANLLGLGGTATEQEIERRAQALTSLERSVLTVAKATDHDAAIGSIGAMAAAAAERDVALATLKDCQQDSTRHEFKALIKEGLKSSKLTLGGLAPLAGLCFGEESQEAKQAIAAMTAVPVQEKKPLVRALCSVSVNKSAVARLKSFLAMQSPQVPTAHIEPPLDEQNRQAVAAGAEKFERQFGLSAGAVAKFSNISSVADLEKAARKAKA